MKLLDLTDDQKNLALANYDKMLFPELTRLVFSNPSLDGRSLEGKSLRGFLTGQGHEVKTTKHEKKEAYELTEEQKTFIENNHSPNMKMGELIRLIFPGKAISPLSNEWKATVEYCKEISPDDVDASDEPVEEKTYKPPRQIIYVVARVNAYVTDKEFDAKKLRPNEEKCMKMLMSYLSTVGFIYQASQYVKKVDRALFEGSFIRYTYDKPDLTAEEVDRFSSLCAEIVSSKQIDRMITLISSRVEEHFNGDEEQRRLGMTMVESMNVWRLRLEGSKKACENLYKELTESRAERIKGRMTQNATFINLLEGWKDPEKRAKMIAMAESDKKKDMDEFDKLTTYDDLTILIAGMSREDMEH